MIYELSCGVRFHWKSQFDVIWLDNLQFQSKHPSRQMLHVAGKLSVRLFSSKYPKQVERFIYKILYEIPSTHVVPFWTFLLVQETHDGATRNAGHVLWSVRTGKGKLDLFPLLHSNCSHREEKQTKPNDFPMHLQITAYLLWASTALREPFGLGLLKQTRDKTMRSKTTQQLALTGYGLNSQKDELLKH